MNDLNDWRSRVKPIRPVLSKWVLLLCVLALLFGIIAYIAGFFGGVWIPFDAFSHLRVHFAGAIVGSVIAIAVLVVWRRKRYVVVSLLCAALCTFLFAGTWASYRQPDMKQAVPVEGEKLLKLMSFNVSARNQDIDGLVNVVEQSQADVVVLVEFYPRLKNVLEQLQKMYPHQVDCWDTRKCNLAIISKKPVVASGAKTLWAGPAVIWASYGDAFNNLTIYGVHMLRPNTPFRQWEQIKKLAGETFSATGPLVVVGDFNATPNSIMLFGLEEFAGLWRTTRLPTWPTWAFGMPQLSIDHQFVSNGVRPLKYPEVGDGGGSDHLPVIGTYAITGQKE